MPSELSLLIVFGGNAGKLEEGGLELNLLVLGRVLAITSSESSTSRSSAHLNPAAATRGETDVWNLCSAENLLWTV